MLSAQNPAVYGSGMKMDMRLGDVTAQAKCDQNKRRHERMRTEQNPQIPWQMNKDRAAHRHRFVARQRLDSTVSPLCTDRNAIS